MFNSLLFVHIVIAIMLIIVILLQKTGSDGLSGIGGGNNMGIMSGRTAANFLTKTTMILATLFFINALILANLSTSDQNNISSKLKNETNKQNQILEDTPKIPQDATSLPVAK